MAATPKLCYHSRSSDFGPAEMLNVSVSEKISAHISGWFNPETGIYRSKYESLQLPDNPFLDVVSFIFSNKHPGVSALVDSISGTSISYPQLRTLIKSVASGLDQIGISQGQVVMMLLPNSIYFPVIYLAALSIGAIVTPINPLSTSAEINKQASDSGVVLAFTVREHLAKIENMGIRTILVPEEVGFSGSSPEYSLFNKVLLSYPPLAPKRAIRQQDTATLLYSSGTSGVSKGVVLTHANLIAMVKLFIQFEASQYKYPSWENVFLASIPMFHVYGLSLFAMGLLSIGSSIVVIRKFNEEEMAMAIERYNVTHFPLVPPILAALTRVKRRGRYDMRCLKQVSCGAAALSEHVVQEFRDTFPNVDFIQGYGLTETSAVGTRGFNTKKVRKHASVGLLAPNMEAKVVDLSTGCCLPPCRSGELWLRGPSIMKGYLNKPDASSSTIDKDGWLHTGDIGRFDQEGFLYITDRLKEIIKYKGFQVAPAELEAVLVSHPDIIDAAVTALINEEAGEIPAAFLVRKPGSAISSDDVIDYVSQRVAPHKKVRAVFFVNSVPRSAAGKILRRLLSNRGTSNM